MAEVSSLHVSVVSREKALANIRRKIGLLDRWIDGKAIPWMGREDGGVIRDGNGEPRLEWFPQTIVEFARWEGSENSHTGRVLINELGAFESFGRSTLDRAPHMKASALRAMCDVQRLALAQLRASRKDVIVETLTIAADAERARKQEAQRLYVDALSRISMLEQELDTERRLRAADIDRLTMELNGARKENALLIGRLRESSALHLAGGTDV